MRTAVYVRMSTDKQEDSPERQKGQVNPYCARKGYQVVETYEDLGAGGWDGTRTEFLRMLEDAKQGRFQLIVMDEMSRLDRRNPIEFIASVARPLQQAGVALESVDRGTRFNWDDDDVGQLLMLVFGQHQNSDEIKKISRRTATGQERKAKEGRMFNEPHKFGYTFKVNQEGERIGLQVVPEQAIIVRRIFNDYRKGMSLSEIVGALNADGLRSPMGCSKWGKKTVHQILKCPKYAGNYTWGKVAQGRFWRFQNGAVVRHTGGEAPYAQAREDWIEIPAQHDPIVSPELFEEVQRLLAANKTRTSRARNKAAYPLSQLMFCPHCGGTMHGTEVRGKARAYRCGSYQSRGECVPNTVREAIILPLLTEHLQRRFLDPKTLSRLRKELQEQQSPDNTKGEIDGLRKRLAAVDAKIEKAGRRLAEIEDEYVDGLKAQIQEWKQEREKGRAELETVNARKAPVQAVDDLVERVRQLPKLLKTADPRALQEFFRATIGRIDLRFDEIPRKKTTRRPLVGGTIYIRDDAVPSLSGRAGGR